MYKSVCLCVCVCVCVCVCECECVCVCVCGPPLPSKAAQRLPSADETVWSAAGSLVTSTASREKTSAQLRATAPWETGSGGGREGLVRWEGRRV